MAPPVSESPSAPVTPAEPSASPTPDAIVEPAAWAAGDCTALLSEQTAPAELGAIPVNENPFTQVAITTLGGISCSFYVDSWVLALAFPVEQVPADIIARYREPVCEGFGYDGWGCRVGRESGGAWTLTTIGDLSGSAEATPLLDATADAVAANVAAATPGIAADRTDGWWPQRTCTEVGAAIDLAGMLGIDEFDEGYPKDGGTDVSTEIVERAGTALGYCAWYGWTGDELRAVQFWPHPGGGWAWDEIGAELSGATALDVGGTTAARIGATINGDQHAQVTDGVNVFTAVVDEIPGDGSAALAEILAALSS